MKNAFYVSDECYYKILGDDFLNGYREYLGNDSHNHISFQRFLGTYIQYLVIDSGDFGGEYNDLLEFVEKNL